MSEGEGEFKSSRVFLPALVLLILASTFNMAFAKQTQVSSTVNLTWFSLQVTYPAEVVPGDTLSVTVQATPKSPDMYLLSLTATVYYADAAGLHQIATQTLAGIPANGYGLPVWGPYGTESFSRNFTVTVPENASRGSLVAEFSETIQFNYYGMYYGVWPPYGYGLYRHRFPFLLSPFGAVTDDAIGTLSFIEATTPEYVSLQSKHQLLLQQLNQSQAQLKQIQTVNDQLHSMVSQENATINQLNQQLASADRTTLTYQLLAVGFGIIALILAAFSFLERRAKEKMRKTAEPSTSEQTGT